MSAANKIVLKIEPTIARCKELTDILARVGDKWTIMVVGSLADGSLRYSQIQASAIGISQRMLTLTLKGLEKDGLVKRTMYPTIPVRVDYELTDLGRTLLEPLAALYNWSTEYMPAIETARARFAERQESTTTATSSAKKNGSTARPLST